MKIDKDNIKLFFTYNSRTGVFKRIAKLSWKGNIIQCDPFEPQSTSHGYKTVNIFRTPIQVHRLIFLYMTGKFPKNDVDHINGDRLDNRWRNLREVTRIENLHNVGLRRDNSTGHQGISKRSDTGRYHAYINVNGKRYNLGYFKNITDAISARKTALKEHKFHSNHGGRPAWVN